MANWMEPQGADYASDEPEFMVSYGRAMAEWGNIEHELARICVRLLQPANRKHATFAYFSIQNFRDRLNFVSSLVQSEYGPDGQKNSSEESIEWGKIVRSVNRATKNRNKLAHLYVWQGPKEGTFGYGHIYELSELPPDWKGRENEVVSIKRLKDFRQGFCLVTERLNRFLNKI